MRQILMILKLFLDDKTGGTSVEYALILWLVLMAAIGSVQLLSADVLSLFTDYNDKYNAAVQ